MAEASAERDNEEAHTKRRETGAHGARTMADKPEDGFETWRTRSRKLNGDFWTVVFSAAGAARASTTE